MSIQNKSTNQFLTINKDLANKLEHSVSSSCKERSRKHEDNKQHILVLPGQPTVEQLKEHVYKRSQSHRVI